MTLALHDVSVAGRLTNVTVSFAPGTLTAVIGENGAGKSTLLDVASGVLVPDGGAAQCGLDGEVLARLAPRERARRVASLGATEPDVDDWTVSDRIALGLVPRRGVGWPPDAPDVLVRAVAGELALEPLLTRRVGTLSTGERRRVAVARALVDDEAKAYVLDEPLSGVDVARQPLVLAALRTRAARGAVVVFSVHELGSALEADRVLGVRAGRVVHDGAPAALDADALERVFLVRGVSVVTLGEPMRRAATRAPT
jgi:iron complex transport system ATP-binding protein